MQTFRFIFTDVIALVGQKANYRLGEQMELQFVLMDFAYGTGGRFFHNSNDLEGGLKQLGMVCSSPNRRAPH